MRTFKIIGKGNKNNIKDGYYVKVDFMYGDADGYTKKSIGPFNKTEEKYLDMFLNMLDKCLKAFPNGKGGFETYEKKVDELKLWNPNYEPYDEEEVKEYDKLIENITQDMLDIIDRINFEWPCTPDDWCCQASITDYKVVYYQNNVCYKVTW